MLGNADSICTVDGGTHIEGVKASITRTLNSLAKKSKLFKEKDISLSGEHAREGLTCIISVKVPNPEFEGQKKTSLGNPEVRKVVDQYVQEYLTEYLELDFKIFKCIEGCTSGKEGKEIGETESVLRSPALPGMLRNKSRRRWFVKISPVL